MAAATMSIQSMLALQVYVAALVFHELAQAGLDAGEALLYGKGDGGEVTHGLLGALGTATHRDHLVLNVIQGGLNVTVDGLVNWLAGVHRYLSLSNG